MFTLLNISFIFFSAKILNSTNDSTNHSSQYNFPKCLEILVVQYHYFPNMATLFSVILGYRLTLVYYR